MPTVISEIHPLAVLGDGDQESKYLRFACGTMAPAIVDSLNEFWAIGRIGVRYFASTARVIVRADGDRRGPGGSLIP